jgi:glycosyltransferase involved in cell wall biosynthesis
MQLISVSLLGVIDLAKPSKKNCRRVCVVAAGVHGLYSLLKGQESTFIGGPDVHLLYLIQGLKEGLWTPSVIVFTEGKTHTEWVDDVEVMQIHRDMCKVKIFDVLLRLFRIWGAMRKAGAPIYIHRGGAPGAAALFCWMARKKYIFEVASNVLVNRKSFNKKMPDFSLATLSLGTFGTWLDIKLSDAVIVQNNYQLKALRENYRKEGVLIRTMLPRTGQTVPEKPKPPVVLWVGSMAYVKRPELFVALANAVPEARFQMIGGPSGDYEFSESIRRLSQSVPNLEFLGFIAFDKINDYFRKASVFVNTSLFEGFPHAVLQAWIHYVPTMCFNEISTSLLGRFKMGFNPKTFDELVNDTRVLIHDEALRTQMGKNARQYAEREHDITRITAQYNALLDKLTSDVL